ncbi:hypothetical protein JTE90_026541 [Oedothorax gibbosus]|uniref:Uncharacterized protein n=1 Tax=Oedothorax gibbosus TaxID=931172 RepID=A0AAV6VPU1_9ARAC|nr:hypothetical protein JTE90_026541 [Oedothorax gibbosus]
MSVSFGKKWRNGDEHKNWPVKRSFSSNEGQSSLPIAPIGGSISIFHIVNSRYETVVKIGSFKTLTFITQVHNFNLVFLAYAPWKIKTGSFSVRLSSMFFNRLRSSPVELFTINCSVQPLHRQSSEL